MSSAAGIPPLRVCSAPDAFTFEDIDDRRDLIERHVLTGAGTSAFVGEILAPALSRRTGRRVDAIATTDIVSNPEECFAYDRSTLLVSFARSGNSPESVAAQTQASSCYYFKVGIGFVGRVLQGGIDEVCEQASVTPAEIRYAFFGLPTYGEVSGDVPTLDAVPGEILGHGRYACDNDTVCGWAGSLGGVFSVRSIVEGFGSALERLHDGYELRKPLYSPVIGAAIYAARLAGEPLDTETLSG